MNDLNYFPLDVESNIYGMTTLKFDDKTTKVLVVTLDCKIFSICYNKFKAHTREVEFTYIPNGAKICSIGALKRGPDDFVIGITHSLGPNIQKGSSRSNSSHSQIEPGEFNRTTTYYLNIYASGSVTTKFDLDYVAQGCQTLRLRYVPYHLYTTELIAVSDNKTIVRKQFWLLSGGDNSVHAFCEDRPYQSFNETPLADCFPELQQATGLVLWIDALNLEDSRHGFTRAMALGYEDGSIKLFQSFLSRAGGNYQVVKVSSFDDFTTITVSVRLFKLQSTSNSKLRRALEAKGSFNHCDTDYLNQLNLLAVNSTNGSIIFKDILNNELNDNVELLGSRRLDCSVTSAIGDLNWDGMNEIIIGTHGKELLTYEYDSSNNKYQLAQVSEVNYPIYAMSVFDLTADTLNDLIILLGSGILVMQASVKDVLDVCKRRLDSILTILS